MKRLPLPDAASLSEALIYAPETGELLWRKTGNRAGFLDSEGYRRLTISGKQYGAHRVIWKMMFDEEPDMVDHVNGVRSDNSLKNLRAATHSQNCANSKVYSSNTSGFKGVSWFAGKWRANINISGKRKHLGMFSTKEEAAAAYQDAAQKVFGEFAPV